MKSIFLSVITLLFSNCIFAQTNTVDTSGELNKDYKFIVKEAPMFIKGDWELASGDGEQIITYINNKNFTPQVENNKISFYKIWTKSFYTDNIISGKQYKNVYSLTRVYVDCNNKKMKMVTNTFYNNQNKLIESFDYEDTEKWHELVIESVGEALLNKACKIISESNLPNLKK
jgi:hypothetical protein